MVRCHALQIYCSHESLHRRILSNPGNDRHQATIYPHASKRSRRRIHQPPVGMQSLLNKHLSNHVVCAKHKHYSVGAAETAINNVRHSAQAMMLHGNVSKRCWHLAIAHAAYLHNVTSLSRLDKSKTIFELLFSKRADLTQVPPYSCFATVYKIGVPFKIKAYTFHLIKASSSA